MRHSRKSGGKNSAAYVGHVARVAHQVERAHVGALPRGGQQRQQRAPRRAARPGCASERRGGRQRRAPAARAVRLHGRPACYFSAAICVFSSASLRLISSSFALLARPAPSRCRPRACCACREELELADRHQLVVVRRLEARRCLSLLAATSFSRASVLAVAVEEVLHLAPSRLRAGPCARPAGRAG